jgi:hypothetical protein
MHDVSASTIRRLMRRYRVTARQIADQFDVPLARVRFVRKHGGPWDWPLMIQKCATQLAKD